MAPTSHGALTNSDSPGERKPRFADSMRFGIVSFVLVLLPWAMSFLLGPQGPTPGSVLDWMMLVLLSAAFASVPVALATIVVACVDLWRRRPWWQVSLGVFLALLVFYAWKDFP